MQKLAFALRLSTVTASAVAVVLALAYPASIATAHEFSKKTVTVSHPWARATPPGAKVGAAYLEVKASKDAGDKLVGARADGVAGRVEIHTHEHVGDVMKMRQLDSLTIEAGKSVVFAPSGHHLMLFDLVKPLEEGDMIKLALQFEKAGEVEIEATVEPIGAKGPHGMDHQPGHAPGEHGGHDKGHDQPEKKQDHKH